MPIYHLVCAHCSEPFSRAKPQRSGQKAYCSPEHQRLGQSYRTGAAYSVVGAYSGEHTCPQCKKVFYPHHPSVVYCEKLCQTRAANQRTVDRYSDRKVIGDDYDPQSRKDHKIVLMDRVKNCPICNRAFSTMEVKQIHLDHDHSTGDIRSILCSSCNQGLGNFKDDIEMLEAAIEYLKYWNWDGT